MQLKANNQTENYITQSTDLNNEPTTTGKLSTYYLDIII